MYEDFAGNIDVVVTFPYEYLVESRLLPNQFILFLDIRQRRRFLTLPSAMRYIAYLKIILLLLDDRNTIGFLETYFI
jgi:hypothetical protein